MIYIQTIEQLKKVSIKNLGPMTVGQWEKFNLLAKNTGLEKPKLIIETSLKKPSVFGITECVYPISKQEWDTFATDTLAKYTPNVHVVDGTKYTAGI